MGGDGGARPVRFLKGHGTENDFVLLPDPDGDLDLTAAQVRALCDRRAGIGADGVLRVVLAAAAPDALAMADDARWFMDYRNADGSIAEMCGNGIRVFARYLVSGGYADPGSVPIATRSGLRRVDVPAEGDPEAEMGVATFGAVAAPTVTVTGRTWPGVFVSMGNPHVVVAVDDLAVVGVLTEPPELSPPHTFPTGANVEFVADAGAVAAGTDLRVAMRVWERGVGETRSCGTGACAAAVAALRARGRHEGRVQVDVPGGSLVVTERSDGPITLTGPAVLLAQGLLDGDWWAAVA